MKEEFKLLLSDRVHKYAVILSIISILVGFIFFLIFVWNLPPLLPLFYNRPWGLPQLGSPIDLLVLLIGVLIIFCINLTLAMRFYRNIVLLSRILLWIAALVSFAGVTAVIRIILLIR